MLSLTSDLESDSLTSDLSMTMKEDDPTQIEHLKKVLDIQGEKLNQITTNNRELINVQSQLARLRSELEKSEMLRQTLEYELTLLRTQHGKQSSLNQHLQQQLNLSNDQIQQLQHQFDQFSNEKQIELNEKDKRIKELVAESETLHERERRIELLNDQIQKMEKSFTDSESISRKNLAQSILAKERELELKRDFELLQVKFDFNEKAFEQEKQISNEAKLNVQLLSSRLNDLENEKERFQIDNLSKDRRIDELERQCSNEKLLRSTLSKLQSDFEIKSSETQKLILDYEKQLKHLREDLANFRRKSRTIEEKSSFLVTKIWDLLKLTRCVNETTTTTENSYPTAKQLEDLKNVFEQFKIQKIDQNNEINRLKKTLERLNKTSLTQKQIEQNIEMNKEKLSIEFDELKENQKILEENIRLEKNNSFELKKDLEKKNFLLNQIQMKFKKLLGKDFQMNLIENFNQIELMINSIEEKSKILEEKLIERDRGTLILTQKLEEQVLHLKEDFHHKHLLTLQQKDSIIIKSIQQIQDLQQQIQKIERRTKEKEDELHRQISTKEHLDENLRKMNLFVSTIISLWISLRKKYFDLIQIEKFLLEQFHRYEHLQELIYSKITKRILLGKRKFRSRIYFLIAMKRFSLLSKQNQFERICSTSNLFYDRFYFSSNKENLSTLIYSFDCEQPFQSFINSIQTFLQLQQRTFYKSIFISNQKDQHQSFHQIEQILRRFDQSEKRILEKENELEKLRQTMKIWEKQNENRVDLNQFERICDELDKALKREKQAQSLLNEQNIQLKSLTDLIHQTQQDKDFIQQEFQQLNQQNIFHRNQIQQLNKSHSQLEDNLKRAEKAIRLVVNDKEQISSYCSRINSILNLTEKSSNENLSQFIIQLEGLLLLPPSSTTTSTTTTNKNSSAEFLLCQTMSKGFHHLICRLKEQIDENIEDIRCLKEHCQMLTEQIRSMSSFDDHQSSLNDKDSTQTILPSLIPTGIQQPIRLQVHHHHQSAFKPIKPDQLSSQ